MQPSLLSFLRCPDCQRSYELRAQEVVGGEVMTGALVCAPCGVSVPIRGGIPRFVSRETNTATRTGEAFGYSWTQFDQDLPYYEPQFLDWIRPVGRAFFQDKVVLDAGCGKGRHVRHALRYGAKAVIGIDMSEAVEVAYRDLRGDPRVHLIQADLLHLPLAPVFDYAYSLGVLHHMEDPWRGFQAIVRTLRPGGAVSTWVYGIENNEWILRFVDPVRRRVFAHMPFFLLRWLSFFPACLLWSVTKGVYRPLTRAFPRLKDRLFYGTYLTYISMFPFRELYSITFDHLVAPIAHYLKKEEVERWYRESALTDVQIAWHNENSWRGFGRRPGG